MSTVDCLNAAYNSDPNAIHALMVNRVPCNIDLAIDDPYVQCHRNKALPEMEFTVDALGLINAVLSANGLPKVAMTWKEIDNGKMFCGFRECEEVIDEN